MKKRLLCCLAFLYPILGHSAPYHLDAAVTDYTWGEDISSVVQASDQLKQVGEGIYQVQSGEKAHLLGFWNNRLVYVGNVMNRNEYDDPVERKRQYQTWLERYTQQWGQPEEILPCQNEAPDCSRLIWYPGDATQVLLYQSGKEDDFMYSIQYASRILYPEYMRELVALGPLYSPSTLIYMSQQSGRHRPQLSRGMRYRLHAFVKDSQTPALAYEGIAVRSRFREKPRTEALFDGQHVIVSGVVEEIGEDYILLSDAFIVPDKADEVGVNRQGKQPEGFFAVEQLRNQLEHAANRIRPGFSVRPYLLTVRMDNQSAIVDFMKVEPFSGLRFALENLKPDFSSNTLSLEISTSGPGRDRSGLMEMNCILMLFTATQPGLDPVELWGRAAREMNMTGVTTINGWTYKMDVIEDEKIIFTATAGQ